MTALALLSLPICTGTSFAAPSDSEKAMAETLFRDAKALMAAKRFSEACPKLAASQSYDPQLGTLLNLAICHESDGKVASAWKEFRQAADLAATLHQPERAALAQTRADALVDKISHLRIAMHETSAARVVKLDGIALNNASLDAPLPIDPGPHSIETSAPSKVPNAQTVDVPASPTALSLTVEPLADAPPPPPPPIETGAPSETAGNGDDGKTMRTLGYGALGLAVVGVGVGTAFGIETIAKKNAENGHCTFACDGTGLDDQRASHTDATVSTVAFAVGVAAAAGGLYLVLAAPRASRRSASWWIAPQIGGLASGGRW